MTEKKAKTTKPRKTAIRTRKPQAKKVVETQVVAEPVKRQAAKNDYTYAVGRRKSAVARVRVFRKGEGITVNGKVLAEYFSTPKLQNIVQQPLTLTGIAHGAISVKVIGGGVRGQAESVRHGIARALLIIDSASRSTLKHAGLLTRDSRVKERKKYGLKRARRAPQWQKR